MKETYKIRLQEVMKEENVQLFREELYNVIKKEIIAMEVPLIERNRVLDIMEIVEIPLDVKSYIEYPSQKCDNKKGMAVIAASATGVVLNSLLRKVPFIVKGLLSFGGAALVGMFVGGKQNQESKGVMVEKIVTPFDEIVSKVDKLLIIIQEVITPKKVMLSDSFSNILEWYQKAYSSCEEFGTDCSDYFKKRIVNILRQNGYSLHDFDGTNGNMFQKTEDSEILAPVQDLPAITNETGYILPGNLFVPKKSNN
ncbi:hypothetical protein [uncultured Prevotella sp.]|uniref:hypothetical protein n=1 Tax=uncultured Prevotella sp. TaxID=159272 RepID=UPI0027E39BA4|nr:hypothetical protein [uncultured Prevotella sp.]